jgi:CHAT domain-containing protein
MPIPSQHHKLFQAYRRQMKRFLWFVMSCCVTLLLSEPLLPLWNLSGDEIDRFVTIGYTKSIAATPPPAPVQPEQKVLVAEVVVEGVTGKLADLIYKTASTKPGKVTTRSQLQEDINAIFKTGWFSNVQAVPKDTPKGVQVAFIVKLNPTLRQVRLTTTSEGKPIISEIMVNDIFRSQYGETLNYQSLQSGIIQINKWYEKNGYSLAQIRDTHKVNDDGTIILKVAEGVIESVKVKFKNGESNYVTEGKLPIAVILKAVSVKSGMVFNRAQIEADLKQVFGLAAFDDVKISLDPGIKNSENVIVVFNVDEKNNEKENLLQTSAAILKAEAELTTARQNKDPVAEATALRILARIQSDVSKYQTALKLSQSVNDRFGIAEAYRGLAYINTESIKDKDSDDVKKEKEKKNKNQSIVNYKLALKIYQELKNDNQSAIVLMNMGFLYEELEEYSAAIEVYQQALSLLENIKKPFWQAFTLINLADNYREIDETDQALTLQQKALIILKKLKQNPGNLDSTSILSKSRSIKVGPKLGSLKAGAKFSSTTGSQGKIQYYIAKEDFEQESLFDVQMLEAINLVNIAGIFQGKGEYQQAIYTFKEAQPLLKISPATLKMLVDTGALDSQIDAGIFADSLEACESFLIGRIYVEIGETQIAKTYFDRTLKKAESVGELFIKNHQKFNKNSDFGSFLPILSSLMPVMMNLLTSPEMKNSSFFEDWLRQYIPVIGEIITKKTDLSAKIPSILPGLNLISSYLSAQLFAKNNSHALAIEEYRKALALWQNLPNLNLSPDRQTSSESSQLLVEGLNQIKEIYYAKTHTSLSQSLLSVGKIQEAIAMDQQAIQLLKVYNSKPNSNKKQASSFLTAFTGQMPDTAMAEALHQLGKSYHANQQYDLGLQSFEQALPLWKKLDNTLQQANSEYEMAIVHRQKGNLTQAKTQIETAIDRIESDKAQLEAQKKTEGSDKSKKLKKSTTYTTYLKLSEYLASKHNYYAFYIDLLMQLHQQSPTAGYEELAFQASERSHAHGLRSMRDQANQKKTKSSAQSQGIQLAQALPLKDIQRQLLDDKTILLEYALGQDRSYLWAVTQTGIKTYVLPKQAEIDPAAKQLIELFKSRDYRLGDRVSSENDKTEIDVAQKVSQMLLAPVADQLENKKILIVGDGVLHYLPFAALPKPGKDNIPLIVDHEIIGLPSASMGLDFKTNRNPLKTPPKSLAILADPIFSRNDDRLPTGSNSEVKDLYDRLPGTRTEATQIAALVTGEKPLIKLDAEANRQLIMNAELAQYRIVHIATHGILNSQNPARSGMVLSIVDSQGNLQRSLLSTSDVFNLKLASDLVVLSGCVTALGKEVQGEGLIGMTGGLMYSGTRQVAAGLWNVDDNGTALLMNQFYQGMLKQGLSPSASLRSAQNQLLKNPNWNAPYYWAAFTIQGNS